MSTIKDAQIAGLPLFWDQLFHYVSGLNISRCIHLNKVPLTTQAQKLRVTAVSTLTPWLKRLENARNGKEGLSRSIRLPLAKPN